MKTVKVFISANTDGAHYVLCDIDVPGLGVIEMRDVVATESIDRLFAEVAAAAELKLRGFVSPANGGVK